MQNSKAPAKALKNEYDFEEANKAFEEMCLKSDTVKVGEEAIAEQVFYDFFQFYFAAFHSVSIHDRKSVKSELWVTNYESFHCKRRTRSFVQFFFRKVPPKGPDFHFMLNTVE